MVAALVQPPQLPMLQQPPRRRPTGSSEVLRETRLAHAAWAKSTNSLPERWCRAFPERLGPSKNPSGGAVMRPQQSVTARLKTP